MDCSPSSSSVHGISQARILEWVAISFSRGSSWAKELNLCLLPWPVDSLLLSPQRNPVLFLQSCKGPATVSHKVASVKHESRSFLPSPSDVVSVKRTFVHGVRTDLERRCSPTTGCQISSSAASFRDLRPHPRDLPVLLKKKINHTC